jgi:hypothetical protein
MALMHPTIRLSRAHPPEGFIGCLHLFRYLDEQAFRFNNRKDEDGELLNDGDRFGIVMRQIVGKRLTVSIR